ncbi:MAG: hypothetical protein GY702_17640 [Desulfobulbaceae bacterium]|nr:hypothetical protein [Desulfobulbaceae bacterium]
MKNTRQSRSMKKIAGSILFSVACGLAIITLFDLDKSSLLAVSTCIFICNVLEQQWQKLVR